MPQTGPSNQFTGFVERCSSHAVSWGASGEKEPIMSLGTQTHNNECVKITIAHFLWVTLLSRRRRL